MGVVAAQWRVFAIRVRRDLASNVAKEFDVS